MYPACNETYGKVHGNFYVPCNETCGKEHGNFHVPRKQTYGKVHGNFHVPCNETYGKVQTRSKLKWVFPKLPFSVEKGDIPRNLYYVHCKSYISNNN